MKKTDTYNFSSVILYILLPVLLIIFWKLSDTLGLIQPYAMPTIENVVGAAWQYTKDLSIFNNIAISFIRVLEGFLIASILALVLGIGIGLSKKLEIFTTLIIQILKPIPPIAWIPLAILWFGIGEFSKVFIIIQGAFFPILINVVSGIKEIDNRYLEVAKVYEVPRKKVIRKVIIPGAFPSIMTGLRIGLGNAWVCVVAAEMIAATQGVGYMLMDGRSLSRPEVVILAMLIIGIIGKLMDDLINKLSTKVIKWKE